MGAYYGDSSALVKRYAQETGTLWMRSLCDPQAGHNVFTAHITGIEVVAAIARKRRMGEITAHDATLAIQTFRSHFATQYRLVVLTTAIVERAMALAEQHTLRGYDAAHLASALVLQAELAASGVTELIFLSADTVLNEVARAEHLTVDNPNDYP